MLDFVLGGLFSKLATGTHVALHCSKILCVCTVTDGIHLTYESCHSARGKTILFTSLSERFPPPFILNKELVC